MDLLFESAKGSHKSEQETLLIQGLSEALGKLVITPAIQSPVAAPIRPAEGAKSSQGQFQVCSGSMARRVALDSPVQNV